MHTVRESISVWCLTISLTSKISAFPAHAVAPDILDNGDRCISAVRMDLRDWTIYPENDDDDYYYYDGRRI